MPAPRVRPATNFPGELTSFVGRRRELAEVKRLLKTTRLLTLTGAGGLGKTRLAVRAASEMARSFPDGVKLVELAPVEDVAMVPEVVATGLGLRDQSSRWLLGTLADYVAGKELLLVLDNCERIVDAVAVLVDSLLRTCPALRVLVTSRQPLRIEGETAFRVPCLSLPEPGASASLDSAMLSEAVTLFTERAAAASPGFALSEGNVAAVTTLCQGLDGIPLAIELAARRVAALTPEQIAAELGDQFQILSEGSRAAHPRHQTLRATVDWSYTLLSPTERVAWRRLSVFASGFDLAGAQAACADAGEVGTVLADVSSLVSKSILIFDAHPGRPPRYRMLEPLRQYGAERLAEAGEDEATRRRHRDWFWQLTSEAKGAWLGSENVSWLARLEVEHDNIVAALDFCIKGPGEARAGLEIAASMWMYWSERGLARLGRRILTELLSLDSTQTPARAQALVVAGVLSRVQGDYESAAAHLNEARKLAESVADGESAALALAELAVVAAELGATERALSLLEQVRPLNRRVGDRVHRSYVEYMAKVLNQAGQPHRAEEMLEEALAITEAAGDSYRRCWLLRGLGTAAWLRGEGARAVDLVRESLRVARDHEDRRGVAAGLETLACIELGRGGRRQVQLLAAADHICEATGGTPAASWRAVREAALKAACEQLGADAVADIQRHAAAMPLDRVVAIALDETQHPRRSSKGSPAPSPLSQRELAVAALVGDGLSNKEIAARLLISRRTVDTHVDHILKKLGLRSRAQVAGWNADVAGPARSSAAGASST